MGKLLQSRSAITVFILALALTLLYILNSGNQRSFPSPREGNLGNFDRVMQAALSFSLDKGIAAESVDELTAAGYLHLPLIREDGKQVRFIRPGESFELGDLMYLPALGHFFYRSGDRWEKSEFHLILFDETKRAFPLGALDIDGDGTHDKVAEYHGAGISHAAEYAIHGEELADTLVRLGYWTPEEGQAGRERLEGVTR